MTTDTANEEPYSQYRQDLDYVPLGDAKSGHFRIYDPVNDISFELGRVEFTLAKLFDGKRSLLDIEHYAREHLRIRFTQEKLLAFQKKLLALGLLSSGEEQTRIKRDPATGITYGPLKKFLLINLIQMNPEPLLNWLYRRAAWLCNPGTVVFMMMASGWVFYLLVSNWAMFKQDVAITYFGSLDWLLWHYPVIITSIAVHELGHALSCRHYNVRVTDFGIGIYLLLATGWVRPAQEPWSRLSGSQRAITILMGPLASIHYAAVGILVWLGSDPTSLFHSLGIVMVTASSLSLIPTLLPIFNGDTYLALTEFFNQQRLRQRAIRYCRARLRNQHKAVEARTAQLYWIVTLSSGFGWLLAWCWIATMIYRVLK